MPPYLPLFCSGYQLRLRPGVMTPILDTELRVCFAATFPSGFFIACRGFALVGRTASGGERLRCGLIFSRDPFLTRAAPWGLTKVAHFQPRIQQPTFAGKNDGLFGGLLSYVDNLIKNRHAILSHCG